MLTVQVDQKNHFISLPFYKQFENITYLIFENQREIENTNCVEFPQGSCVVCFYLKKTLRTERVVCIDPTPRAHYSTTSTPVNCKTQKL